MAGQLLSDGVSIDNDKVDDYLISAEENLQKAIDIYKDYGPAVYDLVLIHESRGKVPEAIVLLEQLAVRNPRDPSLLLQLGLLYYRDERKNDAVAAWEQAVRLFPNYSNARWYLSLAYEERGELEAALTQVEAIETFNPDNELVKQRKIQLEAGLQLIPDETGDVLEQEPLN
jgi:tetratricopeptide (TPR) repeat protein